MILAGIVLSNFDGEKISRKRIAMCIAVFILNGCVSIISKLHQTDIGIKTVSSAEFVMLAGIFKFLFAGAIYLFLKKDTDAAHKPISKKALIIILASAAADGGAYFMQLLCAKTIAATVLYPFVTGGSIVFSAIFGRIIFREKLSQKLIVSIVICFLGTIAFIF